MGGCIRSMVLMQQFIEPRGIGGLHWLWAELRYLDYVSYS